MSYVDEETSIDSGRPYFLYLLDDGVTPKRLTSEPDALTKMAETWTPSSIQHGNLEQTGNIEKASIDLTFPISDPYAFSLLVPVAARVITVTIWRGHHGDATETHKVVWKGRVVGSKSSEQQIAISVESVFTSMRRPGCRVRYQRTCRHALYFRGCNLNKSDFEVPALVTAVNGLVLSVQISASNISGFTNDFLGGIVDWNGVYGFVQSDSGGTELTLITPIDGLADAVDEAITNGEDGVLVTVAPGCRLTRSYCASRFDNILNFGGFPYMPDNNPFTISLE